MELIEALMKVGLTKHEATLYLVLCKEGGLTGYEAAKLSGITRSNVYLALAGLAEKGGACRAEGGTVKYLAVPVPEFTANIRRQTNQYLDYLVKYIPEQDEPDEPFLTISGKNNVVNKLHNMICGAKERIYLSLAASELQFFQTGLVEAQARSLKIVIITDQHLTMKGIVSYFHAKEPDQLRVIVDSAEVLTGTLNNEEATCIYSKNRNLVQLIKDSLTNEIKLIEQGLS